MCILLLLLFPPNIHTDILTLTCDIYHCNTTSDLIWSQVEYKQMCFIGAGHINEPF